MASIIKRANSWRASVKLKGVRQTATFQTKAEAQAWAAMIESEIYEGHRSQIKTATFGELLEEYERRVTPTKRGARWEKVRIKMLLRHSIASVKLKDLDVTHFVNWRDERLKDIAPASVRREWNLLSSAINTAIKEWKWLKHNPLSELKRPPSAAPRERILTPKEIEALSYALGYEADQPIKTISARVAAAMLFAIETGMRAGEIAGLTWEAIHGAVASTSGKTMAATRKVPLSKEALRILEQLPKTSDKCFDVTTRQLDALFRKAKERVMIHDLHFHDTRATAVTRLAKKLQILDLAKMIGHKDLRMLQVYYRDSAEEIAKRL